MIGLRAQPRGLPAGAIFLGVAVLATLVVGLFHLDHLSFTVCVFKAVTGWPCLTCGSTRALGRLFAGDVPGALAMNPLAALTALILVPWGIADLALLTRGRAVTLELAPGAAQAARFLAVSLLLANWGYLIAFRR